MAALFTGCAYTSDESDSLPLQMSAVATPQPEDATPSPQQLQQLVAPIALYPDQLVAEILAASTYPAQIVEADRWLAAHSTLKGDALARAVDSQTWDESVKGLTQFPEVLGMMDRNLAWTSALGEAYMNNSQAVMGSIQQMRQKAQAAGNLNSTPQENVVTDDGDIDIEPVNPDVVYVPEYDPWLVYGAPLGFWPGWVGYDDLYPVGPGIIFGFGVSVIGRWGWGWHHWSPNWRGHGIYHDRTPWVSHSPTFWGHRGGFHGGAPRRPGGFPPGRGPGGFRPSPVRPGVPGRRSGVQGMRSGAFSGFGHGGVTRGFSARGRASFGGGHMGGGHVGGGGRAGGGRR